MNPQISICIPHYNGRASIERCLESLFSSTGYDPARVEIVVVDDASTDDSLPILERYQQQGRICLVRNEQRLGLTGNWNKALSCGCGDVVTLLHQDDWYDKDCLASIIDLFENQESLAFVAVGQVFHPEEGGPSKAAPRQHLGQFSGKEYFLRCLSFKDIPAPSTAFFSRSHLSALDVYYQPDYLFCSEFDLYLRLALAHPHAAFMHDPRLLVQRGHGRGCFSVRYPGLRIMDFCRIADAYLLLVEDTKIVAGAVEAVQEQIGRDVKAILELNDSVQFKKVVEDAGFQKWLKSDGSHWECVMKAFSEKGYRTSAPLQAQANTSQCDGLAPSQESQLDGFPAVIPSTIGHLFKPILILGFHHSGTRLLAKLLHDLGVFQVVDRQTYEWGYIQELNSAILPEWHDPEAVRNFDAHGGSFKISPLELAERLGKHGYHNDRPWGHKDPRTCATLAAWLEVFPLAKVVHIMRDPLDVLGTLSAQYDKFTPGGKLPQEALDFWGDLWLAYEERIDQAAPAASTFVEVRFEDLCLHPHQELLKLAQSLNLSEGRTVDLDGINASKVGIHRQWMHKGQLDSGAIQQLGRQLGAYRKKYGYEQALKKGPSGNQQKVSCFDRILSPVF